MLKKNVLIKFIHMAASLRETRAI